MKVFFTSFVMFVCVVFAQAQSILDPLDEFYEKLELWKSLGLVETPLPPMRPYPETLVRNILNEVQNAGDITQSTAAADLQRALFDKKLHALAEAEVMEKAVQEGGADNDFQIDGSAGVLGSATFFDKLSLAYDLRLVLSNKYAGREIVPCFHNYRYDVFQDPADAGDLNMYLTANSLLFFGSEDFYFQMGVSRFAFGSVWTDGLVLNPEVDHTGNIAIVVNKPKWNYLLSLFVLGASTDEGAYPYPQKYMMLHSVTFKMLKVLEITYYETVIYGMRIEPVYFLPISPFMVSQQMIGYGEDNVQMGLELASRPVKKLKLNANFFLDDMHMQDVIKFDFDTKMKIAFQAGVSYTVSEKILPAITLDYTLVTPWTYTHSDDRDRNYQNYTHDAKPLGTSTPPNSDKIRVSAIVTPVPKLELKPSLVFARHANVNENLALKSIEEMYESSYYGRTDGGILDYPKFSYNRHENPFLKQDHKMYIFQAGLECKFELPRFKAGVLSFNAGYLFEFIYNDGVQNNIYTFLLNKNEEEIDIAQAAADDKARWVAALHNTINHYASFGVKFMYN